MLQAAADVHSRSKRSQAVKQWDLRTRTTILLLPPLSITTMPTSRAGGGVEMGCCVAADAAAVSLSTSCPPVPADVHLATHATRPNIFLDLPQGPQGGHIDIFSPNRECKQPRRQVPPQDTISRRMVPLGVPYRRRDGTELHVLAAPFYRDKIQNISIKCDELPLSFLAAYRCNLATKGGVIDAASFPRAGEVSSLGRSSCFRRAGLSQEVVGRCDVHERAEVTHSIDHHASQRQINQT